MTQPTIKEVIVALRFVATPYTENLANRIEAEGNPPRNCPCRR